MMNKWLGGVAVAWLLSGSAEAANLIGGKQLDVGAAAYNLGFTPLNPANNLSDVANAATARANLGLGSLPGTLGTGVSTALGEPVNGALGLAAINSAGTLSLSNSSTTAPALFVSGQGTPVTNNYTAVFTNDGTTPQSIIGLYYDTVAAVLNMNFLNSPLLQSDAMSAYVLDFAPQGPAGIVASVNAGTNTVTMTAPLPGSVLAGQWISDVSAVNPTTAPTVTHGYLLGTDGTPAGAVTIASVTTNSFTMSGAFGTTITPGDIIKFYAAPGGGSSNGVALQTNTSCQISNCAGWGLDTQIGNLAAQHYANIIAYEIDVANNQTDAAADGIDITGISTKSGISGAVLVNAMDVSFGGARWGSGYYAADGCCQIGYNHPAANASGANNPGAPDYWYYSDGADVGQFYEELATPTAFELGCSAATCTWGFNGQIRLGNGLGSYDEILAEGAGQIAFLGGDPALTQVNIGNSTSAPVFVFGTLGIPVATWTDTQTCAVGQISVDASYVYVCTSANVTKRAALSTF